MIRIMLVDDEPFIRVAVKTLFSWEEHGYQIVSEASNGEAAILKLPHERIDLIITDIKMPVTGGIQLIRHVKQHYPQIQCVVLSNYEDFSLTRNAFMEGAVDYLLKGNLNTDNFSALVQRLNANYFKDNTSAETSQPLPVKAPFVSQVWALQQLINEKNPTEAMTAELDIGLSYILSTVKLLPYGVDNNQNHPNSNGNENLVINTVLKIISEISEFKLCYYAVSTKEYILLIYNQETDKAVFYQKLNAFFKSLTSNIKIYLNNYTVIGASQLRNEIQKLPISYEEADTLSDNIFYCQDSAQYFYTIPKENDCTSPVKEFVLSHIDSIPLLVGEQNWDTLHYFFKKLIFLIQQCLYPPLRAKRLITNLEFLILSETTRHYKDDMTFLFDNETIYDLTMQSGHISILKEAVKEFLKNIEEAALHAVPTHVDCSPIISQAIRYLKQNYKDSETNLGSVAAAISVNPSYLSRIFHKETKEHFNTYLTSLRMKCAKNLLILTQDSITVIAEKSGYNNVKYFINIFKKIEGQTPSAFRSTQKQLLRKQGEHHEKELQE